AGTRPALRRDIRALLAATDRVQVVVTHDPLEAHALADRLVVLEEGRVVQAGTLGDLASRPRSRYVAELAGVNLLAGEATDGRVALDGGGAPGPPGATPGPALPAGPPRPA